MSSSPQKLTDFYMNKTLHHKGIETTKHFISFRQLFYEDPFFEEKKQRPKLSLQSAFLTTKGLDIDLVLPIVKSGVRIVIADDKIRFNFEKKRVLRRHLGYDNFTLIYPPKNEGMGIAGTGCFHSKLFLLKFPTFLRIVIGTGNLRLLHWTNWSNLLWFRDFPKKSGVVDCEIKKEEVEVEENEERKINENYEKNIMVIDGDSDFEAGEAEIDVLEIEEYEDEHFMEEEVDIQFMKKKEMKKCKEVFISENSNCDSRNMRTSRTLDTENDNKTYNNIDLDADFFEVLSDFVEKITPYYNIRNALGIHLENYIYSEIPFLLVPSIPGIFSSSQLYSYGKMRLRHLCQIFNPRDVDTKPVLFSQSTSLGTINKTFVNEFLYCLRPYSFYSQPDFVLKGRVQDPQKYARVIYPSTKDIEEESIDGAEYSETLFLTNKRYKKPEFLQNIFYKFQCIQLSQLGVLDKGIIPHFKSFVLTAKNGEINDDSIIYIGSHNFSEAAWGKLSKDTNRIQISNTELGMMFPSNKGTQKMKEEIIQIMGYKIDSQKYGVDERPFISDLDHPIFKK